VVPVGSVFSEGAPVLMEALMNRVRNVAPGAEFHTPKWMPIVGALLMAMELDVEVSQGVYETLEASFPAFEEKFGINLKVQQR